MPRPRHPKAPRSLMTFPATITLRAMGHALPGFPEKVLAALQVLLPELTEAAVNVQPSQGGNYLSVNVTVTVHSQAQLEALYKELRGLEGIITVF